MLRASQSPTPVPASQAPPRCIPGRVICAALAMLGCVGCFITDSPPADATVLTGTDSAGATIEVIIQKDGAAKAKVSDIVLGTGEAEVAQTPDEFAFTITFPAGVMITYTAKIADQATAAPDVVEGTWVQHAGGVFGEDWGDWTVTRAADAGQQE